MNRGKCASRNISRAGGRRERRLAPSCLPVRRLLARCAQASTQTGREREVKPNIPQAVRHPIEECRRFLRTSYRFLDPHLRGQFKTHLAQADMVVRGPQVAPGSGPEWWQGPLWRLS